MRMGREGRKRREGKRRERAGGGDWVGKAEGDRLGYLSRDPEFLVTPL